jgi:hypothetical protein
MAPAEATPDLAQPLERALVDADRTGAAGVTDTDFEPWTLRDLTDHLRSGDPDSDGRVLREVARRMAEQLPGVRRLDPLGLALDLSHVLASLATVAETLVGEWMADLDDEERPEGVAGLAGQLRECAAGFREISGTF